MQRAVSIGEQHRHHRDATHLYGREVFQEIRELQQLVGRAGDVGSAAGQRWWRGRPRGAQRSVGTPRRLVEPASLRTRLRFATLAVWRRPAAAPAYALGFGAVYLVVTVWGFITGDQVLWLIPVDTADNILHLLIAATGLAAGLSSREATPARSVPRTA